MTNTFHLPVETVQDLILTSWQDAEFKANFLADPMQVLKEWGVEIPDGLEVRVTEDTSAVRTLVIPLPPEESEMALMSLTLTADACVMSACRPCASYKDRGTSV